ncbi:hypothetical protein AWL63_19130 [Sphingomonas panacis]|uniref:Uncharacterized protein n=1 Tax=Sphingomonas panacis TaxID=1560345 RepID=A0A1B3ZE94_9SPHN|nr:hypothetical protein [Sphingomonas panacis]AOH85744.1 hypothetical protein AWL63_19130 [Sphingomonas panacis]
MKTIGIRVSPSTVTFAIYDATADEFVNVDEIRIPAAFDTPESLKYVRSHLLDVMREYGVQRAGIRVTEPSAQNMNIRRVELEGVIQESFASSELEAYYIGHVSSIMSRLKLTRTQFKPIVDGTIDPGIDDWQTMNKEQREAMLCAKGA